MDLTPNKFAYRCLPLAIANEWGWDLYPPTACTVSWDGGEAQDSLVVHHDHDEIPQFADSQFGSGILTFLPGYLFQTPPGWGLYATGPVNSDIYDFATPLTGVVETDWLEFTFTLNWKLSTPGTFLIRRNQPIGRIVPFKLEPNWEAEIVDVHKEAETYQKYKEYSQRRERDRADLKEAYKTNQDVGKVEIGKPSTEWDKQYYRGVDLDGKKHYNHITKARFPVTRI